MSVDINADVGEGVGNDDALMPLLGSANIACGAHAGDAGTMRATVALALAHGVAIGAHPGFADREHFGRREIDLGPDAIHDLVLSQIRALEAVAAAAGGRLHHVKPHGALYNMSARRPELADAIARAVRSADPTLVLYGLPGSAHAAAAEGQGLRFAAEAFADRNYLADGSLVPRSRPDAMVTDPAVAAQRVLQMVREGTIVTVDGTLLRLRPDTICVHGDGANALEILSAVRRSL